PSSLQNHLSNLSFISPPGPTPPGPLQATLHHTIQGLFKLAIFRDAKGPFSKRHDPLQRLILSDVKAISLI
ncbi:hypothetical protein, partial [Bartonella bacilliformis]|uniref:hypothetical protein n=1 Tax=Bartonella bacilliformis TaxID=774 RepID=UPI0005544A87